MDPERWARDIDQSVPSAARMYDYFLGGMHNFAADRAAAHQVMDAMPDAPLIARANRAFLGRAVRYLVDQGVRQFLDVGSGVPTVGNVHEIAQQLDPDARVVYVDVDPVAGAHAQQILAGNDRAAAVVADLRRPAELLDLLDKPERRAVLDLSRPVGLLMVSMLHFVDDSAYPAVQRLLAATPAGSYLAISHGTVPEEEDLPPGDVDEAREIYRASTATPLLTRDRAAITRFFDGLELVEPGLVWAPLWRPGPGDPDDFATNPVASGFLVGVGRKP